MNTRLSGGPSQAGLRELWLEKSPLGIGDPEDLTGAVILLCSDAGKFITGTDIKIDGEPSHNLQWKGIQINIGFQGAIQCSDYRVDYLRAARSASDGCNLNPDHA
jgi:hypothetical protein